MLRQRPRGLDHFSQPRLINPQLGRLRERVRDRQLRLRACSQGRRQSDDVVLDVRGDGSGADLGLEFVDLHVCWVEGAAFGGGDGSGEDGLLVGGRQAPKDYRAVVEEEDVS